MNSKKTNVTLNDLAKALGTSSSTVSRAISNHPKISKATKDKVREMALKMGYIQSIQAAIQQNFNTKTIGILVPSFSQSKYTILAESARLAAEKEGYKVIICCSSELSEKESEALDLFESLNVQGVILSLTYQNKNPDYLHKFLKKTPVVLFDRICFEVPCQKVMIDHFQAGFRAIQHLLKNGFTKIAHIGGDIHCPLTKQISAGYKTALRNGGFTTNPRLEIFSNYLLDDVMKAAEIIFSQKEKPNAILVDDISAAQKLISILQTRKIRIPEDVAILAIGDENDYSYYSPSITTLQMPYSKVGKKAAHLLIGLLNNNTPHTESEINIEAFNLNIKNSTLRM